MDKTEKNDPVIKACTNDAPNRYKILLFRVSLYSRKAAWNVQKVNCTDDIIKHATYGCAGCENNRKVKGYFWTNQCKYLMLDADVRRELKV